MRLKNLIICSMFTTRYIFVHFDRFKGDFRTSCLGGRVHRITHLEDWI